MITTEDKYSSNLDILQNVNQPAYALLPAADKIYNITVNNRKIDNKNITIVEKDHKSATIYFSIDRYVDYMDLAQTKCIIQYNTKNRTYYYPVPFYDIYTRVLEKQIVFPWNIDYSVTNTSGVVPFSIRFFKVGTELAENNEEKTVLTYNLNILPSQLVVEKALTEQQIDDTDKSYLQPGDLERLMTYVDTTMQTLSRKIYWTVLNDDYKKTTVDVSAELKDQLLDIIEKEE